MCVMYVGRDKSGTKLKKDGILESPKVEVFRKFYSKRWSFERWRRQILLQEPGEFFYPSLKGDLLSPEHKTSTKTQFLFEKMQLRSWTLKLKTYVSATKCGRMKRLENNEKRPFLSLSRKSPSQRNPEKLKKNMVFQARFDCNSPVRHG